MPVNPLNQILLRLNQCFIKSRHTLSVKQFGLQIEDLTCACISVLQVLNNIWLFPNRLDQICMMDFFSTLKIISNIFSQFTKHLIIYKIIFLLLVIISCTHSLVCCLPLGPFDMRSHIYLMLNHAKYLSHVRISNMDRQLLVSAVNVR